MEKDLGITEVRGAKSNISDLVVYGDGDTFALLCKASSKEQGWMKSTKVCNTEDGCVVQVTTQQKNPDGSYSLAEALTYVPGANIDTNADPRRLVSINRFTIGPSQIYQSSEDAVVSPYTSKYEMQEFLGILVQLQGAGHDVHAEINETLGKLKEIMFKPERA